MVVYLLHYRLYILTESVASYQVQVVSGKFLFHDLGRLHKSHWLQVCHLACKRKKKKKVGKKKSNGIKIHIPAAKSTNDILAQLELGCLSIVEVFQCYSKHTKKC